MAVTRSSRPSAACSVRTPRRERSRVPGSRSVDGTPDSDSASATAISAGVGAAERPVPPRRRCHPPVYGGGPMEITFDDFVKVDMRVGRIVEVEEFPEARRPAWKLRVDFGEEIGVKRSSAQITNYPREELEGRLVVAVVNFPPRQIGPVRSEVLVLGAMRDDTVILLEPRPGAEPGDRIA